MKKIISFILILLPTSFNLFAQGNWDWQNPYPHGSEIRNVFAFNAGSAVGIDLSGHVVKTENKLDWENVNDQSTINNEIYRVHFIDIDTGWMAGFDPMNGRGSLYKTMNGGQNWEKQKTVNTVLISTHFINADTGWAAGGGGLVIKTENGGESWSNQSCEGVQYLLDICFIKQLICCSQARWSGTYYNSDFFIQ